MITTIVFDMDDTLYDEIDYCRSGFGAVAAFLAGGEATQKPEPIFDALWSEFSAGNHTKTFNAALDAVGIEYDSELIGKLINTYREHEPRITLPEDSMAVLEQLRSEYKLGLLTDGFLPAQQLKVKALGIEKYFGCIIYTEELGREYWKPSPVGFEKLLKTLNVKPQEACYVADNERKDFIAPNELGFLTVQLVRPAGIHKTTSGQRDSSAKYVIDEISQLADVLSKL